MFSLCPQISHNEQPFFITFAFKTSPTGRLSGSHAPVHSWAGAVPPHILCTQNTSAMEIHHDFLLGVRLSWLRKLPGFADITLVRRRVGLTAENVHAGERILLRKRTRKTNSTSRASRGHCAALGTCGSAPAEGREEATLGGISYVQLRKDLARWGLARGNGKHFLNYHPQSYLVCNFGMQHFSFRWR